MDDLTPKAIVAELDKYIVGQGEAKRAVAIALRNRFRRRKLEESIRRDIVPKNILMIGPTGVGKTELARRVAQLIDAPFIKVEATKFTEVGYVGRDVDSIMHDLVEATVTASHEQKLKDVQSKAESLAIDRLVGYLCEQSPSDVLKIARSSRSARSKAQGVSAAGMASGATTAEHGLEDANASRTANFAVPGRRAKRPVRRVTAQLQRQVGELLSQKQLEDAMVEIELTAEAELFDPVLEFSSGFSSEDVMQGYPDFGYAMPRRRLRRVSVKDARRLLTRDEANKLVDFDEVVDEALSRVEESAVVFIDEMDKIAGPKVEVGADVSGEGVQRDLLPIIEGSTVMTRYGPVKTDYILFVGAGSFHSTKPSDLIPELQGRFPLRVELSSLTRADFERILVEPENALTKQYRALLSTENVDLVFTADGVAALAEAACVINERTENIGARRLHTVVERVLEEVSFEGPDLAGRQILVDNAYVGERLASLIKDEDLSRYIL